MALRPGETMVMTSWIVKGSKHADVRDKFDPLAKCAYITNGVARASHASLSQIGLTLARMSAHFRVPRRYIQQEEN